MFMIYEARLHFVTYLEEAFRAGYRRLIKMKLPLPLAVIGVLLCVACPVGGSHRGRDRKRVARQLSNSSDEWLDWWNDYLDAPTTPPRTLDHWTDWDEWTDDWDTWNHDIIVVNLALRVGIPLFLLVLAGAITLGCVLAQRRRRRRRSTNQPMTNRGGVVVQQNTVMPPAGSYPQQVYSVPQNSEYPAQNIGMVNTGYVQSAEASTDIHPQAYPYQQPASQQPPAYEQLHNPGPQGQSGADPGVKT